jgi:methionine biosynthesis protein MetW
MTMTGRLDLEIIIGMIRPGSSVLDLGCGDGQLLSHLKTEKGCRVTGIEIDEGAICKCVENGVTVAQGNIDSSLEDFSDRRFDYVILNESLQEIFHAEHVITQSLRVGRRVIIGIPNFCHLSSRLQVFFKGVVPRTKSLPYQWYNTPNVRFLSLKDFRVFCAGHGITIEKEIGLRNNAAPVGFLRNLLAHSGIFLIRKDP